MSDGAFTRRGMLRVAGGLGISSAAQAARPAFVRGMDADVPTASGVEWPDEQRRGWNRAEKLLNLQRITRGAHPYDPLDYDVAAMKSWAPWAKALKQRGREFERMSALEKIKARFGVTW